MTQPPDLPDWQQPADDDGWHDPADTQQVDAVPHDAQPPTMAMPTLPPLPPTAAVPSPGFVPGPPVAAAVPPALGGPLGPGPVGPEDKGFPWPWVLGGLALVVVLAIIIGAFLGSRAGNDTAASTTTTTLPLASSTSVAAVTSTTKAVVTTTTAAATTTTTADPNVEAVGFARRAVAKCSVDHPDRVSADRPNGIKSTGTVDAKARRYGVVDAKGVGLVVDLANQILTSPSGPTGMMPAPYDACDPATFVGPRPEVTTTTTTTAP